MVDKMTTNYSTNLVMNNRSMNFDKSSAMLGYRNGYTAALNDLQGKIDGLIKALEFYASADNWNHISPTEATYSVISKEDLGAGEFKFTEDVDDERVGGKTARQAIAEFKNGE